MIKNYKLASISLLVSCSLLHGMKIGNNQQESLQLQLYNELKSEDFNQRMDTEKIEQLVNKGADPSRIIETKNGLGDNLRITPLHLGLRLKGVNFFLTDLLLKACSNTGNVPFKHPTIENPMCKFKCYPIHSLMIGNKTIEDKIIIFKLMNKYGYDIFSTNYRNSKNALHIICGADFSNSFTIYSDSFVNNYKIAEMLIKSGIKVNKKDDNGNTPAHSVAYLCAGSINLCGLNASSFKPIIDHTNTISDNVFNLAKQLTSTLRKNNANFDTKNKSGNTPYDIVKILPQKYSDLFIPVKPK